MTTRFVVALFALLHIASAEAQNGFIQSYCYEDDNSLVFHGLLLQNDTLVVYGRLRHPETGQTGLYFSKMDTLGNILLETTHYDSTGDDYFFNINSNIVSCPDGGYAIAGKIFSQGNPIIIKLSYDGIVDFITSYPDEEVLHTAHWNIVALQDGFMTIGGKQQATDGLLDAFVMRTDLSGNRLWEVGYGTQQIYDSFRNIFRADDGNYYISGGSGVTSAEVQSITDVWGISKVLKIDTSGQLIPYWAGDIYYIGDNSGELINFIQPGYNGDWVSTGVFSLVLDSEEFSRNRIEVIKRDHSFNLEWVVPILSHATPQTVTYDLIPGNNQDWITVGRYFQERDDAPGFYYDNGLIAKVSDDGELLWTRTDTLFYDITASVDHYLGGVVVLPSGSIIACGQVNSDDPAPGKSYGWLIKVDKDGCIEPGCNPTSSSSSLLDGTAYDVFPNPLHDQLNVSGSGRFDLELLDGSGRLLQSSKDNIDQTSLNVAVYPPGNYYLRIKVGSRWAVRKVVKQ